MNSIDPNAVLFQLPLSPSAGGPEEKTLTGFNAPTHQKNTHDFETLLAKISQEQGNQEQHKKFNSFSTLVSEDELSNTISARHNTSIDNVSNLPKVSGNTITGTQHSSLINRTIIASVSDNKCMENIPNSNLNNSSFPITSDNTLSLYNAQLDSEPKNSNSSSYSNYLLSNFVTPASGQISPMVLPVSSISNDPSKLISSKSSSQPVHVSSSLHATMGDKSETLFPPALSEAFVALAQAQNLKILDVQNHLAPIESLSQTLQLGNTVQPQDPTAYFEQSSIQPRYNISSFNSNLKPNFKGVASNNLLSKSLVDAAPSKVRALDRLPLGPLTTTKPLNQSRETYSSSVLTLGQTNENSSYVNVCVARNVDTRSATVYSDANDTHSHRSPVLNPLPLTDNETSPSNVESGVEGTYIPPNNSFEIQSKLFQQSTEELNYKDDISSIGKRDSLRNEVLQLAGRPPAHPTTDYTSTTGNAIQSSMEGINSEVGVSDAGRALNRNVMFEPVGVVSLNTANEEKGIKFETLPGPVNANYDFVPKQGLAPFAHMQLSTIAQGHPSNGEPRQVSSLIHLHSELDSQSSGSQNQRNETADASLQSLPVAENFSVEKQALILLNDKLDVVGRTPNLTSNIAFTADPKLNPGENHSNPTADIRQQILGSSTRSPLTQVLMKNGNPEFQGPLADETVNVDFGQFGEHHLRTSISNESMQPKANATSVVYGPKNSGDVFRPGIQLGKSPDAEIDQNANAVSGLTHDQNRADLFPEIEQQSFSESQNRNDIIGPNSRNSFESNSASLPVGVSPVDQITKYIEESVSDIVPSKLLPSPNFEQPQKLILSSGIKTLNLELDPQHLGSINVKLRLSASGLDMHLEASSPGTAQLIDKDKSKLLRGLQESGYLVDTLVVKAADNQTTVLQQGMYGDSGKAAVELKQTETPAAGLNLQQGNSNANYGSGSENSNRQEKVFELDSGSDDVSRSARDGDIYL